MKECGICNYVYTHTIKDPIKHIIAKIKVIAFLDNPDGLKNSKYIKLLTISVNMKIRATYIKRNNATFSFTLVIVVIL